MIKLFKKHFSLIFTLTFFIILFFVNIIPFLDTDIWFHIKSGEIIASEGIIHHDVFSYRTEGREWFPYEWLFQVIVFYFFKFFGIESIKFFIAASTTAMVFFIFLILRKLFQLNVVLSAFCSFFFLVSIFEFIAKRPASIAYTLLSIHLFLILLYYFKSKNWLWVSLPITLLWANMHGSVFLSPLLLAGYGFISLLNYFLYKQEEWLKKFKTLSIFTVISAILTILPPLYLTQYRLLWLFFEHRKTVTNFIDEWTPLAENPYAFIFYSTVLVIIFIIFLVTLIKNKLLKQALWVLPILLLPLTAYTASRNVFLGYITLTLMLGWSLAKLQNIKINLAFKSIFFIVILILTWYGILLIPQKKAPVRLYFPVKAAAFINTYDLKGNIFNEYGVGGYLLYHLYPEHKVFIDGRTDLYMCCELEELLEIALKKNLPDEEYKKFLDQLWNRYHTSYVLVRTQKHQVLRKVAKILTDDPEWNLIYWDDDSQIIVKKDGKNADILKKLGTSAATPYHQNPYREGMEDQAFEEYQRMISTTDSARSRNAIGYLLLQQKKYDKAKQEFEKAIILDPEFESPYMNLAELSYKDGDLKTAFDLYAKAVKLAPDRGLIYIRAGQIYLQMSGDKTYTRTIYGKGIKNTVDDDAKAKLQQLLKQLDS